MLSAGGKEVLGGRAPRRACPTIVRGAAAAASSAPGAAVPDIRLICSDVDGTLLNSKQQLTPGVEAACRQAAAAGVPLVVATGKARGPWVRDVLPRIGSSMPGVFLQGLLIYDADGNKLYSRCLEDQVARECIQLASRLGVTLTVYSDERILCAATDEHTDRLLFYREPTPEPVGALEAVVGVENIQKMIFMAPQSRIDEIRPQVEAAMEGKASLTTALSGMLEVLPLGASKGAGVEWLLAHLGVSASNVMAMGDGENDLEMLELACVGVAMSNAGARVKAAADVVVPSNDEDGVAEAIQRYVLAPRQAAV